MTEENTASPPSGPGGWPFRRWLLAVCLLHVGLGLLLYEPTLFPGGDNAGYMILGESLRSGAGYLDLHLPATPVHTKYPPLYPALIAVLGWLGDLQLFKIASLALTTGAVALTGLLARSRVGAGTALVAAGLVAVNPVLLDYSHWVLSEAPFTLLVLVTLWAAVRTADARGTTPPGDRYRPAPDRLAALAVPVLAAGAFLTRTAGLPLLAAVVLAPALRRHWRRAGGALVVAAAAAGGWALFQGLAAPDRARYVTEFLMVNPYEPSAGTVDLAGLLRRTAGNFWRYVAEVLPGSLTGARESGGAVSVLGGLAVAGLAAAGWVRRCLREVGVAELFLFLYLGLISAWPSVWVDRRFLLPALPLILLYALSAARAAGAGLAARGGGRPGAAARVGTGLLGVAVAIPGLVHAAGAAPERLRCLAGWRTGSPCVIPAQANFYAAARWADRHVPPDAVVANRKPRIFYWISGRKGDVYPYSSEPSVVISGLEEMGADYVVVDALSGTTVRYLVPAVEAHPSRFEVLHREENPSTWVLRFRRGPETALDVEPSGSTTRTAAGGGR